MIRQRSRTIGYRTRDAARRLPVRSRESEEQVADASEADDGRHPRTARRPGAGVHPELQSLYFDVVTRVADPAAANGSQPVYQWRFSDADPGT